LKRKFFIEKNTSDTGCGCLDESRMLLTSGTDSIWFKNEVRYIEQNEGKRFEALHPFDGLILQDEKRFHLS